GMYIISSKRGTFFFADTTINRDPSAEELVEITLLAARAVRFLQREPRIAMLSYSNFGSNQDELSQKVRKATEILQSTNPNLVVDGEIQANIALRTDLLREFYAFSPLAESGANTFIFPDLASANIGYKLVQEIAESEAIGPVLLGVDKPAHILQMGCSVREIVNMTAISVMDAQAKNLFL
ncbi:MAG: phosphate acyltransferase, partial [Bacteroidia bacterium]|nr:phosphate acyltransferase [Bacteroidia bacterium]